RKVSSFDVRASDRRPLSVAADHVDLSRGRRTKGRSAMTDARNVVLVHGGFVDGSGWEGVYHVLKEDGFNVSIVQNPTLSLAEDVAAELASFMADAQVPWGVDATSTNITEAAWRSKPSWYLVATDDHMIPPPAQRTMAERIGATITETPGSHAVYVSNPAAVA